LIERISAEAKMTGSCASAGWWALYTRHQHEKTVACMLETKGFEVFLPLYESIRRWKDRIRTLSLPLFPSYVFVRGSAERRLQIVTTPGTLMIVSSGSRFAQIPDEEIDALRMAIDGSLAVEPHLHIACGDRVRVIRGPLLGVEGIMVRRKNSCRLILSVAMLAQSAAVEIDALDVEPVETPNPAAAHSAGRVLLPAWSARDALHATPSSATAV
jgi:transcription antitermination factor NusG